MSELWKANIYTTWKQSRGNRTRETQCTVYHVNWGAKEKHDNSENPTFWN